MRLSQDEIQRLKVPQKDQLTVSTKVQEMNEVARIKAQAERERANAEERLAHINELIKTKEETYEDLKERLHRAVEQFEEIRKAGKAYETDLKTLSNIANYLQMAHGLIVFNRGRWLTQYPRVRENLEGCLAFVKNIYNELEIEINNYRGENYDDFIQ